MCGQRSEGRKRSFSSSFFPLQEDEQFDRDPASDTLSLLSVLPCFITEPMSLKNSLHFMFTELNTSERGKQEYQQLQQPVIKCQL